jgi:hypothetical protein
MDGERGTLRRHVARPHLEWLTRGHRGEARRGCLSRLHPAVLRTAEPHLRPLRPADRVRVSSRSAPCRSASGPYHPRRVYGDRRDGPSLCPSRRPRHGCRCHGVNARPGSPKDARPFAFVSWTRGASSSPIGRSTRLSSRLRSTTCPLKLASPPFARRRGWHANRSVILDYDFPSREPSRTLIIRLVRLFETAYLEGYARHGLAPVLTAAGFESTEVPHPLPGLCRPRHAGPPRTALPTRPGGEW